jgi:hypothetical protein
VRKLEARQKSIAHTAVLELRMRPNEKALAMIREVALQLLGAELFGERRLLFGLDIQVYERKFKVMQTSRRTEQRAIDLQLRPVQPALVGRHARQIAAMSFEFLQPIALAVVAIGAAADAELPIRA